MNETCKVCGYWRGLHEFQTMKCPVDGHESGYFRETVYQEDDGELDALRARVAELEQFVNDFSGNWETCPNCADDDDVDEPCSTCHGTRRRILSIGVLYVELPQEADRLLEAKS